MAQSQGGDFMTTAGPAALWRCIVPGRPGTKGNSARIVRRGRNLSVAPSAASVVNERAAREVVASSRPSAPFIGALIVDVDFVFAIPESKRKGKNKIEAGAPCLLKVDRGNLLKLIEDAMNGLIYVDDSQVVDGRVSKTWGDTHGTYITVYHATFDPLEMYNV